jgi:hypothetical protein
MLDKTKGKINTLINDRITAPVTTALIVSALAIIIAGIALAMAITGDRNADR